LKTKNKVFDRNNLEVIGFNWITRFYRKVHAVERNQFRESQKVLVPQVRWDEKGNWQNWSEFEIGAEENGRFGRATDFSIKNVIFFGEGRRGRNSNKNGRLFVGNVKTRTTHWRKKQSDRIKDLKLWRLSSIYETYNCEQVW
jgi:hypothetical protein